MRLSFSALVLSLANAAISAPLGSSSENELVTRDDQRGSYTVSGLGYRKQAILNAGGNTLDMAIAMLETENMQTNYAYGTKALFINPRW
jgi:hypothetical protein